MIQKALKFIVKYKTILICLLVLGMFGYTLWRVRVISNPVADPSYVEAKRSNQQNNTKLQVKDALRAQIEQLQEVPVNTQPGQLGTNDPFNP